MNLECTLQRFILFKKRPPSDSGILLCTPIQCSLEISDRAARLEGVKCDLRQRHARLGNLTITNLTGGLKVRSDSGILLYAYIQFIEPTPRTPPSPRPSSQPDPPTSVRLPGLWIPAARGSACFSTHGLRRLRPAPPAAPWPAPCPLAPWLYQ